MKKLKTILSLFVGLIFSSLIGCTKNINKQLSPTTNGRIVECRNTMSFIIDTSNYIRGKNVTTRNTMILLDSTDTEVTPDWYLISGSLYRCDLVVDSNLNPPNIWNRLLNPVYSIEYRDTIPFEYNHLNGGLFHNHLIIHNCDTIWNTL